MAEHIANSDICRRCGQEDHRAASYGNAPECALFEHLWGDNTVKLPALVYVSWEVICLRKEAALPYSYLKRQGALFYQWCGTGHSWRIQCLNGPCDIIMSNSEPSYNCVDIYSS